jgi:hypothetical protein
MYNLIDRHIEADQLFAVPYSAHRYPSLNDDGLIEASGSQGMT